MITDNDILNYFIKPSGIITEASIKHAPIEYIEYLKNKFTDSKTIKESILRIKYNIINRPVCPVCGKEVEYLGLKNKLYRKYCSNYCQTHSIERIEKTKQTCIEKYGVDNQNKNSEIREKIKQTCIKKYGVDCVGKVINFHYKRNNTCLEKYGYPYDINKYKQTCLEKYGNEFAIASEQCKQKSINTRITKYNVKYSTEIPEVINKIKNNPNRINNIIETKRKNRTFNKSFCEEEAYELLKTKYSDIIRQYKSDLYPFSCDFYIPSLNLYIEYNGSWTHGGHPYNILTDSIILEEWYNKATKSDYYKNAIETWTIRDVKKREIAKQNHLNYIEFWNINEVKNYVKTLC